MNKRATKILTIATLSLGAPAFADQAQPRAHEPAVTMTVINGTPYRVTGNHAPQEVTWREYGRFLGETGPLVGRDGRPACGNVMSQGKSGNKVSGCEREQQTALKARRAALTARVVARARGRNHE